MNYSIWAGLTLFPGRHHWGCAKYFTSNKPRQDPDDSLAADLSNGADRSKVNIALVRTRLGSHVKSSSLGKPLQRPLHRAWRLGRSGRLVV
jgi:hypothetical protein